MKNKTHLMSIFFILIFGACNNNDPKKKSVLSNNVKRSDAVYSINYICDISKDTTLLVADSRILSTTNSGKSWHVIKEYPVINQVTVDNKNVIWAIYYWGGIHEPGRSTLLKSSDWGKTWKTFEFNLSRFAPEQIISNAHERLKVINGNKVFELAGDNPLTDFSQSYTKLTNVKGTNIAAGYESIDSNDRTLIFKSNNGKRTIIASLDSVGTLNSLIKVGDTLFAVGNGVIIGNYAKPYFSAIINKKIKRYNVPGHHLKVYKGYTGRVWAITGGRLYLKNDTGLMKVSVK